MEEMKKLYTFSSVLYDLIMKRCELENKGKTNDNEYKECLKEIDKISRLESEEASIISVQGSSVQVLGEFMSPLVNDYYSLTTPLADDMALGAAIDNELDKGDTIFVRMRNLLYGADTSLMGQIYSDNSASYEHHIFDNKRNCMAIAILDEYIWEEQDERVKRKLLERKKVLEYLAYKREIPEIKVTPEIKSECEFNRMLSLGGVTSSILSTSDYSKRILLKSYLRSGLVGLNKINKEKVIFTINQTSEFASKVLGSKEGHKSINEALSHAKADEEIYGSKNPILEIKA